MPVDFTPTDEGSLVLTSAGQSGTPSAQVLAPLDRVKPGHAGRLYMPHWATCPGAAQARRPR